MLELAFEKCYRKRLCPHLSVAWWPQDLTVLRFFGCELAYFWHKVLNFDQRFSFSCECDSKLSLFIGDFL